jgi:hypothetical protein
MIMQRTTLLLVKISTLGVLANAIANRIIQISLLSVGCESHCVSLFGKSTTTMFRIMQQGTDIRKMDDFY